MRIFQNYHYISFHPIPLSDGPTVCLSPKLAGLFHAHSALFTLPPNAQMAQNAKKYAKKAGGFLGIRANYIIFVEKYHNR